jgi:predicted MFS family arabinose efflux permease
MFEFLRRSSPLWCAANFNRLWAAQILSAFGSRITRTAIPIIAVGLLSASPWEAAVLAALTYAPYVLTGALGGGFVERNNKTRIMVAMDIFRFAIVIATPIAWYFDLLSFPLLCVLAAGAGAASALFQNADVAILPKLVGKDMLVDANARLQATESIAELTGPGIAGILIDLLTAPIAMMVDAFTFIWSAFWLWKIPKEAAETKGEETALVEPHVPLMQRLRDDLVIGFLAIWRCRPMRAIITATFFWYISAGFFFATFTLFMLRVLGMSPTLMGIIISVGGAAALLGSLMARPLSKAIGYGPAIFVAFVAGVVGLLMLIPAAAFREWSILFMVLQQIFGDAGMMIFTILAVSLQQRLLREDQLARANGFNQVINGFAMTVSILAAGWVAETVGVANTVIIGASVSLIGIIPLLTRHLLGVKEKPPHSKELAAAG